MQQPIIEDPDVAQSVRDLRAVAQELRDRTASIANLSEKSPHRRPAELHISDLYSRIALRADRHGITAEALLTLINDDLNARARRGRAAPQRQTTRTVGDRLLKARAREEHAHRQLSAWQIEVKTATAERVAAEQALAAYGIGVAR